MTETDQSELAADPAGAAPAPEASPASAPGGPTPPRRGSVALYALAFALMILAGAILVVGTLGHLSSIRLLWVSVACSSAAVVAAVASVVVRTR